MIRLSMAKEVSSLVDNSRRQFLRQFSATAGCFILSAVSPFSGVLAAVQSGTSRRYSFPQGVASADPQPDAVLLWTRIVDADGLEAVPLSVEVSSAENFNEIILQADLKATADTDFTVRAFVDGLSANQWFYYRFVTPDGHASRTGRTRTAPAAEADSPLNIAVFSCQHYEEGFFNAYRRMMLDDQVANDDERIDLCMHMGDFIYENVNGGPGSFDEDAGGGSRFFQNADGTLRSAGDLPSGGRPRGRGEQLLPQTLDDYRHIYKSYLHDTAIQEARAWYPFVYIWDDHEVLNDYWQAYHPGGSIQKLKVAGNQAWFEYLPAILTESAGLPAKRVEAKDFEFVEVTDSEPGTFDENHLSEEPNTLAAIGSMTIYRSLQWGKMADLLLLDGRSYRGPRGLDNTILGGDLIAYPPAPVDEQLVRIMNEGLTANGGEPPATLMYEGKEIPNPRVATPRSSMLGARQKQWLKDSLTRSTARWQFLGNNVPMMRFGWDTTFRDHGTRSSIFWTDSWDGYPVERQELMEYISAQGLTNVISLTGDRHAHFAGMVYADYESDNRKPVIPELVGAGISAQDRFTIQQILFGKDPELSRRTSFDGAEMGKTGERLPAMNAWLIYGAESARILSDTADIAAAKEVEDPDINPHLLYSDIDAYGYYTLQVRAERVTCEFVTTIKPVTDQTEGEPEVLRRVRMEIPQWAASMGPVISELSVEGQAPLMGIRES
jgi:alkaline phosphatase D